MFNRFKYAIFSTVILTSLVIYASSLKVPIPIGEAEDYWKFACGIEVKKFDGHFPYARETGIFPSQDEWYFYYFQEHHGRHVYKIKKTGLLVEVGEVLSLLDQELTSTIMGETRPDYVLESNKKRVACLDIKKSVASEPDRFIDVINIEIANKYDNFDAQWERSKRYWISIIFEVVFLSLWWLFSFHAGVFGKLNKTRRVRIAFSPLLLFFPHFIGYAPYLFSFGPSGGILYPIFASFMSLPFGWLPFNPVEISILSYVPQPLSYISQVPFSPLAMSFYGSVSPTVVCVYAGLVLAIGRMVSCRQKKLTRLSN